MHLLNLSCEAGSIDFWRNNIHHVNLSLVAKLLMSKDKEYHYYLLDNLYCRVSVICPAAKAEVYVIGQGHIERDREQICLSGKRITWEAYIRGISSQIIGSTNVIDSNHYQELFN